MGPWCRELGVQIWGYCLMPMLKIAGNWRLLTRAATEEEIEMFRQHERTGRVLGDDDFQKRLEKNLGRILRRQKPGPKRASSQ
jgi:putative transposase